jgi:hypothetical protein
MSAAIQMVPNLKSLVMPITTFDTVLITGDVA